MLKKLVFFAIIIFTLFLTFLNEQPTYQANVDEIYQVIPDEAIRLRILANSDGEEDQALKHQVRDAVNEQITDWVAELTDIEEARQLIQERIPEIKKTANEVLTEQQSTQPVEVEYGENVTFPVKLYDTFIYPAGEYEAVLITLGEGQGANWWCVLFPPLCFLDFSNSSLVAEEEPKEEKTVAKVEEEGEPVKVRFFLFEWFGWT